MIRLELLSITVTENALINTGNHINDMEMLFISQDTT